MSSYRFAFGGMVPVLCAALVLAFGWAGCKTPAPAAAVEATVLPADAVEITILPPDSPEDPVVESPSTDQLPTVKWPPQEELAFSVQTTPCFGTCPVYKLEVYRDGTLRYQGIQFTERIGTYRGNISVTRIAAVVELAEAINFARLQDVYPTGNIRIMDLPSSILYLRTDAWQKQVVSRRYANPDVEGEQEIVDQLRELQSVMDALLLDVPLQQVGEGRQD